MGLVNWGISDEEYPDEDCGIAVAGFRSRCGVCDEWIEEGDDIHKVEGEWAHAGCQE